MKRDLIRLLTGSLVAVTSMLAPLSIAQPSTAAFPGIANANVAQANGAQLQQKRPQLQSQIGAVITTAQRQQFVAAIEQGQSVQAAITAMNLSPAQKVQLQQVLAASGLPNLAQLNLTQEQKAQLTQVSAQVRTQLDQILTAEQRQQFKITLVQGRNLQNAIASANLSAEQKTQLRQVMQSTRTQLNTILTADQKQQLRQSLTSLR